MASELGIIERLIDYVSTSQEAELPQEVVHKTKHHILDTFAAMISGTRIKPGQMALSYAALHAGGAPEAQVVASPLRLPIIDAAIANGMLGHSDETDDSNGSVSMHPGSSILPAAFGMAEREDRSGMALVRAVALGYDVGPRFIKALGGRMVLRRRGHLPFSIGGTMGAASAAGVLAGLTTPDEYSFLFSYAAQQASGVMTYARDTEHIEKAFIFGGMPARNGLTAALMVQAGFTGVWDVLSGDGNFLAAFSDEDDLQQEEVVAELGSRFELMLTNIKKYCVGFPIQSAIEALLLTVEEGSYGPEDVESIVAYVSPSGAHTVNDREMPNISLQYLFAIGLLDGTVEFMAAHDVDRMDDPAVKALRSRITVTGDPSFEEGRHQSRVEVVLKDGRELTRQVDSFRGKAENPLSTEEVEAKARGLIEPVLGASQTTALIEAVRDLETMPSVRGLSHLLALPRS